MAPRKLSAATLLLACTALLAACSPARSVSIQDGWIERPSEGSPAELHLQLRNGMDQVVRLVGASVEGSENAVFLSTAQEQRLPAISLNAGQTLQVPKDGYRILIEQPSIDWGQVEHVNLQLAVEQADGQLLTLSYDLHVHEQEEALHHH